MCHPDEDKGDVIFDGIYLSFDANLRASACNLTSIFKCLIALELKLVYQTGVDSHLVH